MMRIVDVNVSLGARDADGRIVTRVRLLEVLERNRMEYAVCYHRHALLDPLQGNSRMAEEAASSGGRLKVCAVLDPILGADCLPGEGTLIQRLQVFRPAALRIFPGENRTVFHPFYWEEILDAANALSLPLFIDDDYSPEFFIRLPEIAAQYPKVKFILLRYGLCRQRHVLPLLTKCENVYFTAEQMLDNLQLEEIEEKAGLDKLLFGSGYPFLPHAGALGLALFADITEENRRKLLAENWEVICG